MLTLGLIFFTVKATILDYRFSINFGVKIWDYSGNNNHGTRNLQDDSVRFTDRGAHLRKDNSRIMGPVGLELPVSVSYLTWVMAEDTQYRFIFRGLNENNRYFLGRISSSDSVYINVDYQGNKKGKGSLGSFPSKQWLLVVLSYDGQTFRALTNSIEKASVTCNYPTSFTNYNIGIGTSSVELFTSVRGFVWNFLIMQGSPDHSLYMINSPSSSCLIPGTCSCTITIVDSLGNGCLPINLNSLQDSEGSPCDSTSAGCSVTINYICNSNTVSCGYDRTTNTCFEKNIVAPFEYNVAACPCRAGFISINNQCCKTGCNTCNFAGICCEIGCNTCNLDGKCCMTGCLTCSSNGICCKPGCQTCDNHGDCLTCKSLNSHIVSGFCYCVPDYYPTSQLTDSDSCCIKNSGCASCINDNPCTSCANPSAHVSEGSCICNDGFYAKSASSCEPCGAGCQTCSELSRCLSCFDLNSYSDGNECKCNSGFYITDDSICASCQLGCKECSSTDPCISCIDNKAILVDSTCICALGFYIGTLSICTACGSHCKTCSEFNLCISCYDTLALNTGVSCECMENYFMDENSHFCTPCQLSCKRCNNFECLECINENFEKSGKKCKCKPGFWSEHEPSNENSCQPCFDECLDCTEKNKCLTCVSKNALPLTETGCICKEGFWNKTSLLNENSCIKCNSQCLTCLNDTHCTSCKDPFAEVNQKGECIVLCSKVQKASCVQCNELCENCDKDLKCITCSENAVSINKKCICRKGYEKIKGKCKEKYFYANFTVLNSHQFEIKFSEPSMTRIKTEEILLEINQNNYKFYLKRSNSSNYRISVLGKLVINTKADMFINITRREIYSSNNSMLFNYEFFGKVSPETITIKTSESILKPIFQIAVAACAGMGASSNPAGFWSLFNMIQLIIYLPLNSVPYSERFRENSDSLNYNNLIPIYFRHFSKSDATSPPSKYAKRFGISTTVIIINTRELCLVLAQCLATTLFFVLLHKCFKKSAKLQKYKEKYKFNILIRFWIEAFLELSIFAFIQLEAVISTKKALIKVEGIIYICISAIISVSFI